MIGFSIKGNELKISIAIYGYENDQAEDVSDANWLNCKISIKADSFSSEFDVSLTTQDFSYFYDDLNRILDVLSGNICFQTDEEWIEINIETRPIGEFIVSGVVRPSFYQTKTMLTFKFKTDESCLLETLNDLERAIKEYPIKN